jgi:hypothetical protein
MLSKLEGQMTIGDDARANESDALTESVRYEQEEQQLQASTVVEAEVSLDPTYYEQLPPLPSDPNICAGCSTQVGFCLNSQYVIILFVFIV